MKVFIPRGCFFLLVILFGFTGVLLLAKGQIGSGIMTLACVGVGILRLMFEK
jgi:hypothetical protein